MWRRFWVRCMAASLILSCGEVEAQKSETRLFENVHVYPEKDARLLAQEAARAFVSALKKNPQGLFIVSGRPVLLPVYQEIVALFAKDTSFNLARARFVADMTEEDLEGDHILSSRHFLETAFFGPLRAKDAKRAPKGLVEMDEDTLAREDIGAGLIAIGGASPVKVSPDQVRLEGGTLGLLETGVDGDFWTRTRDASPSYRAQVAHRYKALARLMAHGEVKGAFACEVPKRLCGLGARAYGAAKHLVVVATGEDKGPVLAKVLGGASQGSFGCELLTRHPHVSWFVDEGAAWEINRAPHHAQHDEPLKAARTRQALPSALPQEKRVLILSPHPDDDVISMGATVVRLLARGNKVRTVYAVTGTNAVSETLASFVSTKEALQGMTQDFDSGALILEAKAQVREEEARAAVAVLGQDRESLTFLRAQYYDRRGVPGLSPLSASDRRAMEALLLEHRPHVIYFAAENDPNGAHGLSTQLLAVSLESLVRDGRLDVPQLYGYRGAYSEWPLESQEPLVIVPFDAALSRLKTQAIQAHESQLDPLYPSFDPRPFFVRARDRNASTLSQLAALCGGSVPDPFSGAPSAGAEAFKAFTFEDFVTQYSRTLIM